MAKVKGTTAGKRSPKPAGTPKRKKAAPERRLYTLDVFLISGPIARGFTRKNRVISRTIQIRGDQTLQDLHEAIFDAFDREEEHMYEFQFGKRPMDPKGPRYVLPMDYDMSFDEGQPPAGRVDQTTLDALNLKKGRAFRYWFDFGDDWWHQINVEQIEPAPPSGKFPKVVKKVGASPPQYPDWDAEENHESRIDDAN